MINEHYTPEAVILANGEYPTCPVPLTMLEEASFVACCDGAANEYISRGHTPDVIVSFNRIPQTLLPYYTSDTRSGNERPD